MQHNTMQRRLYGAVQYNAPPQPSPYQPAAGLHPYTAGLHLGPSHHRLGQQQSGGADEVRPLFHQIGFVDRQMVFARLTNSICR